MNAIDTASPDTLSDHDLLAQLIGDRAATMLTPVGLKALRKFGVGEVAQLIAAGDDDAQDVARNLAQRVVAALALGCRVHATPLARATPVRSSRDVVRAFGPMLVDAPTERFIVVALDARQRPLATRTIATGTVNSCAVDVREVFAFALRECATDVILMHNHPSGGPSPSEDDIAFTRRAVEAGATLGVMVVDHVIVASEGSFSFLDAGLLKGMTFVDAAV